MLSVWLRPFLLHLRTRELSGTGLPQERHNSDRAQTMEDPSSTLTLKQSVLRRRHVHCATATSSRNSWGRRSTHSPFTHVAWFFVSSRRSPNSIIRRLPVAQAAAQVLSEAGQQHLRGAGLCQVVVGP